MNLDIILTMKDMYLADPIGFQEMLSGDSATAQLWRQVIADSVDSLNEQYASISNSTVVQLDMEGNVIFASNNAYFADTKQEIKSNPGSVNKFGDKDILVADCKNKRAVIWRIGYVDVSTFFSSNLSSDDEAFIKAVFSAATFGVYDSLWEYNSDRYVTSFQVKKTLNPIEINDGFISNDDYKSRQGESITWLNNTSIPISIYSGLTDYDRFYSNSDLSLYGSLFKSTVLQPGEEFSTKLYSTGNVDWFVYPQIMSGKISVSEKAVNENDIFVISESDGLDSPFSSRIINVNFEGNIVWEFGSGYSVKPKCVKSLLDSKILVST